MEKSEPIHGADIHDGQDPAGLPGSEAKPDRLPNFKRFRLNIPIRQLSKWMPMDKWDKCDGEVDETTLAGRKCARGLDMSLKIDLTAFVMVFAPKEGDDVFDVICKFYCPEEGILLRSRRDRVPYDVWRSQGHIIATPGETVDDEFIKKDIIDLVKRHQIDQIGFDSWKAQSVHNHIMAEFNPMNREDGFQMAEIRQGARSMHEPAQDLLSKMINGKIRQGGNPVLRWNMDNMVMRSDPNENLAPDKAKAVERIDGAVALIMSWSRIMFMVSTTSVYETRGVVAL